ncbi:MAG: hypothetical protein B6U94_07605 [Thermofilum sp. ex4484_79]|nr:MAG: hypothetical protein B6U94_07605 [Thermofilum sp. ex4484_79]
MVKVLYVGDAGVLAGPIFFASPFMMKIKGLSMSIFNKSLIDALESDKDIKVVHMNLWDAFRLPKTLEELKEYDVVILSDINAESIYFYPEFHASSEIWKKDNNETQKVKGY